MLNVDLSRALPPRPYLYFSPFLPGLLFEFSILLANPGLARELAIRLQEGIDSNRFLWLFVGLFLAFVIGSVFMLVTSLVQFVMGFVYRIVRWLGKVIRKYLILRFLTYLTNPRANSSVSTVNLTPKRRPRWVYALQNSTFGRVTEVPDERVRNEVAWWDAFVRQLLLKRYGLPEEKLPAVSFQPLQDVLTDLEPEDFRGSMMMNALESAGWAALVVPKFAPALRCHWYLAFAAFLLANGLLHDFYVTWRLNSHDMGHLLRIRAILREFPKMTTKNAERPTTTPSDPD